MNRQPDNRRYTDLSYAGYPPGDPYKIFDNDLLLPYINTYLEGVNAEANLLLGADQQTPQDLIQGKTNQYQTIEEQTFVNERDTLIKEYYRRNTLLDQEKVRNEGILYAFGTTDLQEDVVGAPVQNVLDAPMHNAGYRQTNVGNLVSINAAIAILKVNYTAIQTLLTETSEWFTLYGTGEKVQSRDYTDDSDRKYLSSKLRPEDGDRKGL